MAFCVRICERPPTPPSGAERAARIVVAHVHVYAVTSGVLLLVLLLTEVCNSSIALKLPAVGLTFARQFAHLS